MLSEKRYARTLERAMALVGGEQQLAELLRASPRLLRKWLSGRQQPPLDKYLVALELVTSSEAGKS